MIGLKGAGFAFIALAARETAMMNRVNRTAVRCLSASSLALVCFLTLPQTAFAEERRQPPPPQMERHHEAAPQRHARSREHPQFNADQSGFVRDYYRHNKWEGRPLPHGQRIAVGRRLPRGIERHPLPPELARRFPHRPGYETYIVGDNIVLVAVTTGIVVDMLTHMH